MFQTKWCGNFTYMFKQTLADKLGHVSKKIISAYAWGWEANDSNYSSLKEVLFFFSRFFFVFVLFLFFFCFFFSFLLSESMCLDCIIQSSFWKQNVLMILHRCCICCWVGCRSCWSIHMFRMTWCHVQKLWLTLLWEHLCTYYIAWKLVVFGVFLVRIFPHWDWIRRDNPFLPVFSPNAGKYRPEKLQIPPLFTQSYFRTNSLFDTYLTITITW